MIIMGQIGVLAYGSLINDPSEELDSATISRIENVKTPFKVEFARSSNSRNGAPTLIPVEDGGANVNATIFVLKPDISRNQAETLLWRRETRKPKENKETYRPSICPGINTVQIKELHNVSGLETILYTFIPRNINPLTVKVLARLAIQSVQGKRIEKGLDGISYLISTKKIGIITPLSNEYEEEILRQVGAASLEEALTILYKTFC